MLKEIERKKYVGDYYKVVFEVKSIQRDSRTKIKIPIMQLSRINSYEDLPTV